MGRFRGLEGDRELAVLRQEPVVELVRQGDATVVVLAGEIDLHTVEPVRAALDEACAAGTSVVVDLSRVEFLDSTAIGLLLAAGARLVGARPGVRRALEVCGALPSLDGEVVVLAGEIDVSADGFRRELEERLATGARRLIVDLSGLTFLPTPAIDVLLSVSGRLREAGGELLVVAGAGEVGRIFTQTMLDRVLPVYATRADALGR